MPRSCVHVLFVEGTTLPALLYLPRPPSPLLLEILRPLGFLFPFPRDVHELVKRRSGRADIVFTSSESVFHSDRWHHTEEKVPLHSDSSVWFSAQEGLRTACHLASGDTQLWEHRILTVFSPKDTSIPGSDYTMEVLQEMILASSEDL